MPKPMKKRPTLMSRMGGKPLTGREVLKRRDPVVLQRLEAMGAGLKPLIDKPFSDDKGRMIQIVRLMRPLQDFTAESLEFVLPLTVIYQGSGTPDEWAALEKDIEGEIAKIIVPLIPSKLVRRTKVDPFKSDPRSMTLLRYQRA